MLAGERLHLLIVQVYACLRSRLSVATNSTTARSTAAEEAMRRYASYGAPRHTGGDSSSDVKTAQLHQPAPSNNRACAWQPRSWRLSLLIPLCRARLGPWLYCLLGSLPLEGLASWRSSGSAWAVAVLRVLPAGQSGPARQLPHTAHVGASWHFPRGRPVPHTSLH